MTEQALGTTNDDEPFRPGEMVAYGSLRATVLYNHGSYGDVRMADGTLACWRWSLTDDVRRASLED